MRPSPRSILDKGDLANRELSTWVNLRYRARRRKAPIQFDNIYAVRSRLPGNNFDKEQIRVQLQLLDANFDVVTVYGTMDIFHVKEYVPSLSQGQRSHFFSSFSSFLQRMLHRRDCSLFYDISKATCTPRRYRNV